MRCDRARATLSSIMNDICLRNNGKEDEGYKSSVGSDDHFGLRNDAIISRARCQVDG